MNRSKISNYMMNIGIALSIYSIYKIYDSRKGLPIDACPINENDILLYIAIAILMISLILSFIDGMKGKKIG